MAGKAQGQKRGKPKDNGRRHKKRISPLTEEQIVYVDYKDVNLMRRFTSDRAKMKARRVTGNNVQQQRKVVIAIKNAREMALIPYVNRVTTQRGGRDRDRNRAAGPPPTPSAPPPATSEEAPTEEIESNEEAVANIEGVTLDAGTEGEA